MLILVTLTFLVAFGIIAVSLRLGLRWTRIPDVSWPRVLAATALVQLISAATILAGRAATGRGHSDEAVLAAEIVTSVVVTLATLGAVLRTGPRRAMKPWLATVAGSAVFAALMQTVAFPYLFEAFAVTSNAMAPTLLGRHHVAACPHCGGPAYSTPELSTSRDFRPPSAAICGRCLRASKVINVPAAVGEPDRFLVDKLSSPRRWDVVAYRYPEDPSVRYVHRVVGLPGEEVSIKEGAVWVDGRRRVPPPPIEHLAYASEPGSGSELPPMGDPERSWSLGPDEYFVLGDFSSRSRDSRAWTQGAPGHPAFAVPRSNIVGPATYIYWPPSRWRRLR
jgi:signal peptidase I